MSTVHERESLRTCHVMYSEAAFDICTAAAAWWFVIVALRTSLRSPATCSPSPHKKTTKVISLASELCFSALQRETSPKSRNCLDNV